jgi:hypothetical protein
MARSKNWICEHCGENINAKQKHENGSTFCRQMAYPHTCAICGMRMRYDYFGRLRHADKSSKCEGRVYI